MPSKEVQRIFKEMILILLVVFSVQGYSQTINLTTGEFPPFVGKDLKNGGLATEIITRVFNEMGQQTVISYRPWKRGFYETLAGKYFATFPYSKNKEREKKLYFSDTIYDLKEYFFVLKKTKINYQEEKNLTNLRICKPLGYNLFGLKKLADENIILITRPKDMEACFRMLKSNRVDLVMTNEVTASRYINAIFTCKSDVKMLNKRFVDIGHHLIIPKATPQAANTIKVFNEALEKLKLSGEIGLIIDKHIN